MVGGTYLVTSGGTWSWDVVIISLVYAAGPTTVLFGKHTDKIKDDLKKGVHTLPVIIGETSARYLTMGLWISQYVLLALLVYTRIMGPFMAVVLLAIPMLIKTIKVFKEPRPESAPADLPPDVWPLYLSASAFTYTTRFGILFLAGLMVDVILKRLGVF
jgi:1,4-dihydroxy-2-naphthoate octaprenyltransferase